MKSGIFLIRILTVILSILTTNTAIIAALPSGGHPQKAKYVFLFIGDGMGLAEVNLTQGYLAALQDKVSLVPLNFTKFPQVGLVSTYANNEMITCSAAAGTALATGHKTNIGRLSMDTSGTVPLESIASKAKSNGYKVGIVTNTSIDHATPAAFYAHQPDRNNYYEIAVQLSQTDFDFFAGGGFMHEVDSLHGKTVNLVQMEKDSGFQVVNTREEYEKLVPGGKKVLLLSPKPAEEGSLPFSIDAGPGNFTLSEYTSKAISMLDNKNGFFLMVEGGKIDWACHEDDAATAIHEVIEFDKAIGSAVEFYQKHPDETLIIVTADHETGGLTLGNKETGYQSHLGLLKYQKSSNVELNKIIDQFRINRSGDSLADFTRMMKILDTDLGLNSQKRNSTLSEDEMLSLKKAFYHDVYEFKPENKDQRDHKLFMSTAIKILAEKAGIGWTSTAHTCVNVPVYSIGQGSEKFSGCIDNTDVPRLIGEAMGLKE